MQQTAKFRILFAVGVGLTVGLLVIWLVQSQRGQANAAPTPQANAQQVTVNAGGELQFPASYNAKIAALSKSAESCLLANGATRTPSGEGGYAYTDSSGTAYNACSAEMAANETLRDAPETQTLLNEARTRVTAFKVCLGIDNLSRTALENARVAGRSGALCAAGANAVALGAVAP